MVVVGAGGITAFKRFEPTSVPETPPVGPPQKPDERCDDQGWCTQIIPEGAPRETTFAATWAASPSDVWAVGLSGVALHFDGLHWTQMHTGVRTLRAVYGFASNDVWLAGTFTALHWDGAQLKPYLLPVRGEINDVFGVTPNDVWAVGSSRQAAHWDGNNWSVVDTGYPGWLEAVWGSSKNDVWAAGGHSHDGAEGVIAHWDGANWRTTPLPCHCGITALSGTAQNDVWAVGSWGVTLHYDGQQWARVPSPAKRGLMGLWAQAPNDAWAVGEEGMVLHYDGAAWHAAKPDWKWLRGVTATRSGDVWAVGQDGWLLRSRAETFKPMPPAPASSPISAPATPSETKPTPTPTPTPREVSEEVAKARKLQADGKIDAAYAAYVAALGTGYDPDPQALAELAFLIASHRLPEINQVEGAYLSAASTDDPFLEAQAWFNLGTFYEERKQSESARVAFARSLARRDHASVRAKLAGRSTCLAEFGRPVNGPKVVGGWREVCKFVAACTTDEAVTEAVAQQRTCALVEDGSEPPECAGAGPWKLAHPLVNFGRHEAWVSPLSKGRYFVGNGGSMSQYNTCTGDYSTAWTRSGDYVIATYSARPLWSVPGRPPPATGEANAMCGGSHEYTDTSVYEHATAKLLATVTALDKYPVAIEIDQEQRRVNLSGSACDGFIALDGSLQWFPNKP